MEGGFVLDLTDSAKAQAAWVEGEPERSRWTGLKLKDRRQIPIYAWRCPRCSVLRLFAPEF
jgi:hypothetical protein